MSENLTTRFFREQMRSWSEAELVRALVNGLPWHEHAAARELLATRRQFEDHNPENKTSLSAPRFRLPTFVQATLALPLLAAAFFFAVRSGHAPQLRIGGATVAPKSTKPLLKLGFRDWRIAR